MSDHYALEFMRFLQGQGIRRLEVLRDGTPCDAGIVLPVELVERESTRSAFKRKRNARSPWRFGHGGRAFYVYFPSTTESLISFSISLRSRAPPSATVTCSS